MNTLYTHHLIASAHVELQAALVLCPLLQHQHRQGLDGLAEGRHGAQLPLEGVEPLRE